MLSSRIILTTTLLIVTGILSGIAQTAFARDETALVIYSGRSDKFVKPVIKLFSEKTGIKVILHTAKSTALLNKLRAEGPRTEADLYLSNDAGNLQIGADMGLFKAIPENIANVIPKNLRAPDNSWIGLSARSRVLVINTKSKNTHFIKSVFDLADPRLKGRLGITHSSNESFIAGTAVYLESKGEAKTRDWLEGINNNSDGEAFNKHSKIVAAVAKGRKDVGLVNHYYIYRHLDKSPDSPIRIVIPDQSPDSIGVAWNVAGIAISKYSKKVPQAQKLVEFLISTEGQKLFAQLNREYPTRKDAATAAEIAPLSTIKVADVPMSSLGRLRNKTLDMIEAVGLP